MQLGKISVCNSVKTSIVVSVWLVVDMCFDGLILVPVVTLKYCQTTPPNPP